jgi:hypothetical protein
MSPAIHIKSRSWLRSSSTHEPSDPPLRVIFSFYRMRRATRRHRHSLSETHTQLYGTTNHVRAIAWGAHARLFNRWPPSAGRCTIHLGQRRQDGDRAHPPQRGGRRPSSGNSLNLASRATEAVTRETLALPLVGATLGTAPSTRRRPSQPQEARS